MKKIFNKTYLLFLFVMLPFHGSSEDYFDPSLLDEQLGIDPNEIDLSHFSQNASIPTGTYTMMVYVNQTLKGEYPLNFVLNENSQVVPEMTPAFLADIGVKVSTQPKLRDLAPNAIITDLSDYIPDASITTDLSKISVAISIPQIAMDQNAIGYIDPSLLDNGIPGIISNYMFSANHAENNSSLGSKTKTDNLFVSLLMGANAGAWRLRSTMTHAYNHQSGNEYSSTTNDNNFSNTYVSRNIYSMRSDLLMGESSTNGDILNSVPFRGVKLFSNEQMLPDSLRGFAPDINGIAQSNAQITIRQNGYVVYQTYVSPGPFSIKDLVTGGNSGALDITIKEEDGTERTYTVAFSTLPVMQRPGGWKYELTAGRYDGGITIGSKKADFVQATGSYGLPKDITLYGGSIVADDYWSSAMGIGASLGTVGAISTDVTFAQAKLDEGNVNRAQAYRVRYSKNIVATNTSIDLSGTKYSSKEYFSFGDFNNFNYRLKEDVAPWLNSREKNQYSVSISQPLNDYGNVYISANQYEYWDKTQKMTQLSTGYNNSFKGISYSINYSIDRVKNKESWPENRQVSVNISVPFRVFSNSSTWNNINSTYSVYHDNSGKTNHQAGVSGSFLDNKLTYGVSQGWGNQGQNSNGSIYANYSGSKGTASAGYNYSKDYYSVNAGYNGSVVAYSDGLIFGRTTSSSIAIIEAEGADGTELTASNAKINSQGKAIYPYLADYSKNTVGLNVNTLPDEVTLQQTSKNVYPTSGAIIKVKFETKIGYQALIHLTHNDQTVPFGAVATLMTNDASNESNTGLVGDDGVLYMSGLPNSGKLQIKWGTSNQQLCIASFDGLKDIELSSSNPLRTFSVECQSNVGGGL
ncbi:fimbria/pilus outer membrane usher protein [Providencia vermicola]|uniref:fimbria/pilus outer membrane usher protein n=1 Tax=Providencia vermicola TaxID=333965 RepID=UPI001CEDEFEA|nr:fimbria/pilus outer membrane usher protein [Providencia vermicola]